MLESVVSADGPVRVACPVSGTGELFQLISHRVSLPAEATLEEAQRFFSSKELEFVAVLDQGRVAGLCARREIGIILGSRFGFSLFSRKPLREHLRRQVLVIGDRDPIPGVLERVSSRPDEFFYDDVLLVDADGVFLGAIHVQNLVRLQHGVLLNNLRKLECSYSEIEHKNRQMELELSMASKVQAAMLPQTFPTFPANATEASSRLRFYHRYLPAGRVSGDFFHVRRISDLVAGVFVCDVMGHGVQAAMITATLRALVEELHAKASQPHQALERLNQELHAILRTDDELMYASAVYLVVDVAGMRVRWASAGHPCPLCLRHSTGQIESLALPKEQRGKVLGLFARAHYHTGETAVEAGDRLVLYTDGVYEVFDGDREFGEEGLRAALGRHQALPGPQMLDQVLADARTFGHAQCFEDDVCLLGMEIGG